MKLSFAVCVSKSLGSAPTVILSPSVLYPILMLNSKPTRLPLPVNAVNVLSPHYLVSPSIPKQALRGIGTTC